MFKFKDGFNGKTKEEIMSKAKEMILELKKTIKALKYIDVGINSDKASKDNYDFVLVSEFDDFDALEEYAKHEDHKKVIDYMKEVTTSRACVDYEYQEVRV